MLENMQLTKNSSHIIQKVPTDTEKKIYPLYLEWIVKHFLNPLTRNVDFQDIR